MATFDGKGDWDAFIIPFERAAHKFQWDNEEKLDRLYECIRGDAMRYLVSLPNTITENYGRLARKLGQRYGQHDLPQSSRRKLNEVRQGSEELEEYAERIASGDTTSRC